MDWLGIVASTVVGAAAVVVSVCLSIQTFENRRFARSRAVHPLSIVPNEPAAVIVPCKGLDLRLAENLRRLFHFDYWPYQLLLVVESEDDPAAALIDRLIAENPQTPARRIVAGVATSCGQKVHNLRAAVSSLGPNVAVIAFVDSDAQPRADWLRRLARGLMKPEVGAVTGYRWFVPQRATLPNLLLSSINAAVAALFGPGGHNFVWGGSWAIRRETFERVGLADAWRGTLSDDFVASRVVKSHGLQIRFESGCLAASPLDVDWAQMAEFLRRQYLIGRCYVASWWQLGFLGAALLQIVFWGGLAALSIGLMAGAWWTPLTASCVSALYLLGVGRAWLRQRMARDLLGDRSPEMRAAALFDIVCAPLAGLVSLASLFASLWGRSVTWRGVRYRMFHGGRIEVLAVSPAERGPRAVALSKAS